MRIHRSSDRPERLATALKKKHITLPFSSFLVPRRQPMNSKEQIPFHVIATRKVNIFIGL